MGKYNKRPKLRSVKRERSKKGTGYRRVRPSIETIPGGGREKGD